jgi:hypothetical protein
MAYKLGVEDYLCRIDYPLRSRACAIDRQITRLIAESGHPLTPGRS